MNEDHHPVGRPSGERGAELLPCPWGCEGEIGHRIGKNTLRHVCMVCGAAGPAIEANAETAEAWSQAGAAWNRRTPNRALLDRIEELEAAVAPFAAWPDELGPRDAEVHMATTTACVTFGDFRRARKALSGEKP